MGSRRDNDRGRLKADRRVRRREKRKTNIEIEMKTGRGTYEGGGENKIKGSSNKMKERKKCNTELHFIA